MMSSAGAAAVAAPAAPPQDDEAVASKLSVFDKAKAQGHMERFEYREASQYLWDRLLVSDPKCIDWIGDNDNNVPLLYLKVRNVMRFIKVGCRVLGRREIKDVLVDVVYLIVRVHQDVNACELVLAKSDVKITRDIFYGKLMGWLADMSKITLNGTYHWPPLSEVMDVVEARCVMHASSPLPLPLWVPNFYQRWHQTHMYFGNPDAATVTSGNRNEEAINGIRIKSAVQLTKAIRHAVSWTGLMGRALERLLTISMKEDETTSPSTAAPSAAAPAPAPAPPAAATAPPQQQPWGSSSRATLRVRTQSARRAPRGSLVAGFGSGDGGGLWL